MRGELRIWGVLTVGLFAACKGPSNVTSDSNVPLDSERADSEVVDSPAGSAADAHIPDAALDAAPDAMPDAMPDAFFTPPLQISEVVSIGAAVDWEIAEVIQWSAIVGTAADGYAQFNTNVAPIIPNHQFSTTLNQWGPKTSHAPPHLGELTNGVTAAGYTSGTVFTVADWTPPKGINIMMLIVPKATAPTGKTGDGNGMQPMIPNASFPFHVDGDLYIEQGGLDIVVDFGFDSDYTSAGAFNPSLDGWSHFFVLSGENTDFLAPMNHKGRFHWYWKIVDKDNNGYAFKVESLLIVP